MRWPFRRVPAAHAAGGVGPVAEMAFPGPDGTRPIAARLPWRLPGEPAMSGIAADAVTVGALTVRAASIVGPGHRCEEPAQPRQDAYRLGRDTRGRHLLVAVADGMSDSSRSHQGATVAVAALVGRLRRALDENSPPQAPEVFLEAARQMAGMAEQQRVSAHEVRAAAVAAVVPVEPDPSGGRDVWLAWLADTAAWQWLPGGWRRLAGEEKRGLDAGRLSEFLPFHADQARSLTVRLEKGTALAITTDGIGDMLAGGHASWFADRWTDPPHIASFLQDVGYEAKGQLDDRTAVMIWCDR